MVVLLYLGIRWDFACWQGICSDEIRPDDDSTAVGGYPVLKVLKALQPKEHAVAPRYQETKKAARSRELAAFKVGAT